MSPDFERLTLRAARPTTRGRLQAALTKRVLATARRATHPVLRGQALTDFGPRLLLRTGPAASLTVGEQVVSPGDLSLSVQGSLTIGHHVFFGRWSLISCLSSVTIGDRVRFGERVSVHDANHSFEPLGSPELAEETYLGGPISIGDRVWLGAGVIVLPNVSIGADTVVGAGSVVSRSLPAGVLAAGRPAEVIRALTSVEDP